MTSGRKPTPRNMARRELDEALFVVRSCRDRDRRWKTAAGRECARALVKALLTAKDELTAHPNEYTFSAALMASSGADLAIVEYNAAQEILADTRTGNTERIIFHGRQLQDVRSRLGKFRLRSVPVFGPEWPEGVSGDDFLAIADSWAKGKTQ